MTKNQEARLARLAEKPRGTAHCQQCGSTDYEDLMYTEEFESYTNCCNERVNLDCDDRDDCFHLVEYAELKAELANPCRGKWSQCGGRNERKSPKWNLCTDCTAYRAANK